MRLKQPTRALGRAALERTLHGLAPDGVYRAAPVTRHAGGLLHHLFTLTRARRAVYFLWHFPAGFPEWALPTIQLCGARTFLETRLSMRRAVTRPAYPASILPRRTARSAQRTKSAEHSIHVGMVPAGALRIDCASPGLMCVPHAPHVSRSKRATAIRPPPRALRSES